MFWNNFYQLCKKIGKSPNAVAKELGISSGSISWWKKGKIPHNDTLNVLAKYFNVSVGYLLGYEQNEQKEKTPTKIGEGEQELFELWNNVPAEKKEIVIKTIKALLENL